jgi:hypothetical protein
MKQTKPSKQTPMSKPRPRTAIKATPGTYRIEIVTGGYRGSFVLDGRKQEIRNGSKPFDLSPGTHTFDTGVVARSFFEFTVSPNGVVSAVTNPIAAWCAGNELTLNTVEVTVDAGPLISGGNPYVMGVYPFAKLDPAGKQKFTLVPGLAYQLDSGGTLLGSTLVFDVHGDGTIWCRNHSASGGMNRLTLNVDWLKVVPDDGGTTYTIGRSPDPRTGTTRIPVILGLATALWHDNSVGVVTPEFGEPWDHPLPVGGKRFTWSVPWNLPAPLEEAGQGRRKKSVAARSKPRA